MKEKRKLTARFLSALIVPVLASAQVCLAQSFIMERISVGSAGEEGNNFARYSDISADGRYVVFESAASNLVAGDGNGRLDLFIRDRLLGTTELLGVGIGGVANKDCMNPQITPDGRYVVFVSEATNLVPNDANAVVDVFVYDRTTHTTERINTGLAGAESNAGASYGGISHDGRFVVFESPASNLVSGDVNDTHDIFVKDRVSGTIERVNVSSAGAEANDYSANPSISADGRYVVYDSLATNLISGDTNGMFDVFMYDRQTNVTERVNLGTGGVQSNGFGAYAQVSRDGRYVTFYSGATNLVSSDTNGVPDVFLYDRQLQVATLISISSSGEQGNAWSNSPSLSSDSSRITFYSAATNLVDPTGYSGQVLLRDLPSAATTLLSASVSGEPGNNTSSSAVIRGNGFRVPFISNASNLVPDDTNNQPDVYLYASLPEGDVDGSGQVTAYDAALAAQYAGGLISILPEQILAADMNKAGGVTAADAALIAQRAVGL